MEEKILILICFILIAWLFYKQSNINETMADVGNLDQVKEAVRQVYLADVEAIRNLSNVASQLQAGGLTIPGNLTVSGGLNIKGELITESGNFRLGNRDKDQWMFHSPPDDRGGLWIARVQRDGNINWSNGLNLLTNPDGTQNLGGNFNIIPKGTIMAWNGNTAPAGWALCDGANGTPDLRGRFVLGLHPGGGKNTKVPGADYNQIGGTGGNQVHQLSGGEMPSHNHKVNDWAENSSANQAHGNVYHRGSWYTREQNQKSGPEDYNALFDSDSGLSGGNEVHNNMPPYYVLAYIIKL